MEEWIRLACVVIACCTCSWTFARILVRITRTPSLKAARKELRTEISKMREELQAEMAALTREQRADLLETRIEFRRNMVTLQDDWE